MEKEYVLVSGILKLDKTNKRNIDAYISLFKWIYDLNIPTILYVDPSVADRIKPRKKLHIIPTETNSLPNIKKISSLECPDNIKIPSNTQNTPYYFGVISSKMYLLEQSKKYIIENIPEYENKHLVWIDAGISHVGTIEKEEFINHMQYIIHDKINLTMMKATSDSEISNLPLFLSSNRGKIAGGLITVPWNKITWFSNEITNLFDYSINELKQYCLEEQFFVILSLKHKSEFKFIYSDYYVLYNLKYIKVKIQTVINNLTYCSSNGLLDIGIDILYSLIKSIDKGRSNVTRRQVCKILLGGFIISYHRDKVLCKKIGELIHYLYHHQSECKVIIKEDVYSKTNLKFIDIDLDIPSNTDVLNEEYSSYIWSAL
uniref:Uncharacterized protein n=1 Tax=Pithovirus LCPAC101 TaxID=2506586 RepID=A0A481Z4D5_9VIRU|nr:MAG: hypothetical protein LCPAC101_01420 [Pithovirus LCPAC101]